MASDERSTTISAAVYLIVVAVSRSMLRSDPDAADKIELAVLAAVDLGEKP